MSRLFSFEGRLFQTLSRITDLILLNVLWIVTSLPIITIGASTTALYYVTLKTVRNEESYIIKSFFRSFRQNFRQASILWTAILAAGFLLYYDSYIIRHLASPTGRLIQYPLAVISIFLLAASCYTFPVLSRFSNTIRNTFKNAVLMSASHLHFTAAILLLNFGPLILMLRFPQIMIIGIFFYLFIGFALCAWMNSFMLRRVFDKCEFRDEFRDLSRTNVRGSRRADDRSKSQIPGTHP